MTTALPPVRPWRLWLVWGVGVAAYVLSVTNRTSLSSVGVDAAVRFDADASALSLFAVIQLAVYGAMQIPVGLLLDRFGARPIVTAGMVLMALGQLVMAFASDVGIGILARVLIGAGDAAVFPSVLRLIAVWFPDRQAPVLVQFTGHRRPVRADHLDPPARGAAARDDRGASRSAASPGSACSSRSSRSPSSGTTRPIAIRMSPSTPRPARSGS